MKIYNLFLSYKAQATTLSVDIAFKGKKPERMYFATDLKNKTLISSDYSPFLAAVLLPCMKSGEDIIIEGPVSKKLLANAKKIMDLVVSWNVGLKKVNIKCHPEPALGSNDKEMLEPVQHDKGSQTASFFSAGVDSFYTYLKHKDKKDKIKNLILVHGFDIPLKNNDFFESVRKTVEQIAIDEKINAISVETNAGEIVEKYLIWDLAHGGVLAAIGLFVGSGLSKIFIPAGLRKDELFPYGTHPDLDKLWSTENTEFVHDGTEYNRLGKIMNTVSKSSLALKYLRVCAQNIKGKYNCSRCYKCLQTMIELVCAGVIEKAETFDKLDLKAVRNMHYDYVLKYNLQGEANLDILKRLNRELELQNAIAESLEKSKKRTVRKTIFENISHFDRNYNSRRLYSLVFKMNRKQDRNMLFKLLNKMGALK